MKLWISSVVILLGAAVGSPALAQCCKSEGAKTAQLAKATGDEKAGCKATCTERTATAGKAGCAEACASARPSGALATAGVPTMKCRVGEQMVNCPIEAEKLAKADSAKITYVVGGTEYMNKDEALQAYAQILSKHLTKTTAVRYAVGDECLGCPQSAAALAKDKGGTVKYRVASYTFETEAQANKAAEAARAAADKVTMKTLADGDVKGCDPAACAAKSGAATAGTCGEKHGQVKVARTSDASGQTGAVAEKGCHGDAQQAELAAGKTTQACGDAPCCAVGQVRLAMAKIQAAEKAVQEFAAAQQGQKVAASGS
ncbi:MAG: hypothetical protein AB1716_11865 [Planctomycetota bacterium]